jgi:hypothetical protein
VTLAKIGLSAVRIFSPLGVNMPRSVIHQSLPLRTVLGVFQNTTLKKITLRAPREIVANGLNVDISKRSNPDLAHS